MFNDIISAQKKDSIMNKDLDNFANCRYITQGYTGCG